MGEGETKNEVEFITVDELSEFLRVNKMTVHRLIERGELAYYRIGKLIRFRRSDVDEFLAKARKVGVPETQHHE